MSASQVLAALEARLSIAAPRTRARSPLHTIDIHGHTPPRPLPACAAPDALLAAIAAQMQAHAIAPPVLLAPSFSRQGSGIATSPLRHGRCDRWPTPPHAEHATPPARQMGGSPSHTPHRHRPHTTENAVAAACRPVDRVLLRYRRLTSATDVPPE